MIKFFKNFSQGSKKDINFYIFIYMCICIYIYIYTYIYILVKTEIGS